MNEFPPYPPRPGVWGELVDFFDLLGRPLFAGVVLAVTVWLVGRGLGWRSAAFVTVASAGVAVNAVLKAVMGITPLWTEARGDDAMLNYPSGHVVYAVVMAGSLGWIAHRSVRRDLAGLALITVVLMGPMRVVGATHLPSDVLAGYLFGAAWLAVALAVAAPPAVDRDERGSASAGPAG